MNLVGSFINEQKEITYANRCVPVSNLIDGYISNLIVALVLNEL
jgi:hypothetical protein